jgi:xylulokinase
MADQYLIGVDIGSSSTKASLFNAQGNALADVRHANRLAQPRAGTAEYDGRQLLQAAYKAIREVLVKSQVPPQGVAAICFDGMISGTLGIDSDGDPTTPYTTTLDLRFAPQLNWVMERFHAVIREKTGSGQPTIAPKMMWIRDEFPDVYGRTAKFVTVTGYLAGKMAGLSADQAFVDHTHLWATGLSDTQNYAWSEELCSAMGLPVEKLPRIVEPSKVIGGVCRRAAEAVGLVEGTPIVAGAGDQSAGFVGAGVTEPNRMGDAAGTYLVISLCTDQFRPDLDNKMAEVVASAISGLWNPVSIIIGGGLTHRWFQETFACVDETKVQVDAGSYQALDEDAAALAPGSDRLIFVPHLGGRACPTRTNYRGLWIGFTWTHTRAHFYRALLEAIAYDQSIALQSLQAAYPESRVTEVLVYGGGSRSGLWNQIKADVLGLPYVRLDRDDMATLGAAIIAGFAVGLYDDIAETADRFVSRSRRFEPRADVHRFYTQYTEFYRHLLDQLDPAYDDLASLPRWKDDVH